MRFFGAFFAIFFDWIRLTINHFLLKDYRKFFLFFALCLDARMEIKNCNSR